MKKNSKIYIAGHDGMVGSAIVRNLKSKGYDNLVFTPYPEFDLTDQKCVINFFTKEQPEYVINAAAKVGGIFANITYRAQFIYENMMIQNNLIHFAHQFNAKKLLFLGSSCIYPKFAPQPMKEEHLLTGELEYTNEPYAIAKISGIKMCESYFHQYGDNFISVMPTNLYGPNDNFDLTSSHVLPALVRKFHEAKEGGKDFVEIWGTGKPKREFLYVDDLADACVYLLEILNADKLYNEMKISHINIGCGEDLSIAELAETISSIVGFKGKIRYDASKPDGTPRKLLDISRLKNLGWHPSISFEEGINTAYKWFIENISRWS
ncbi:MAG TPA: GDP-L-fucose synthase [Candidatus Marinimicrobia bacterium]|nr:GDP-L-fucose synthase [Candidatus Neomarinimicrobiota bacterium]